MSLDSVHNYYERLVLNEIREKYSELVTAEELADMACIALNRLPPRYIRYDIDMSFYMTPHQYAEIEKGVTKSCKKAYKKIIKLRQATAEKAEIHNHGSPNSESDSENQD